MATKREQQAERKRQMRALDQLPPSIREVIYYAPVNFNPCMVLEQVHQWGEHIVLRQKKAQIEGILSELNREKFEGVDDDARTANRPGRNLPSRLPRTLR